MYVHKFFKTRLKHWYSESHKKKSSFFLNSKPIAYPHLLFTTPKTLDKTQKLTKSDP